MTDLKICQHLKAKNDHNGNPRRLWIQYECGTDGCLVNRVLDERHGGQPLWCDVNVKLPNIEITPTEFNHWKKKYRAAIWREDNE